LKKRRSTIRGDPLGARKSYFTAKPGRISMNSENNVNNNNNNRVSEKHDTRSSIIET
jgi:hypothetical protein